MLVIQRKAQRKWAYSNMMSVIRYHLMTYIDLFKFLKNPEAKWEEITTKSLGQLSLFDPQEGSILKRPWRPSKIRHSKSIFHYFRFLSDNNEKK